MIRAACNDGVAEYDVEELSLEDVPQTRAQIMLNLGSPGAALRWARLPAEGVGLARIEFIISHEIKLHPLALVRFDELEDAEVRERIGELTRGWEDKQSYFVDQLAFGVARLAACQYPRPAIVRISDFKTNEYAELMGWRGLRARGGEPHARFSRRVALLQRSLSGGFALECRALRKARDDLGLTNIVVMIPFCRTPEEADRALEVLAENGLIRGRGGLSIYAMC